MDRKTRYFGFPIFFLGDESPLLIARRPGEHFILREEDGTSLGKSKLNNNDFFWYVVIFTLVF